MPRTVELTLLLLLCATAVSATGPTNSLQSPPIAGQSTSAGDVEMLALDAETRTDFVRQSIDVSAAVATQRESAQNRLDRHALGVEFEETSGEQARRELLFQAATQVEIEISGLQTTQRELRTSYVSGEIPVETFLQRQAVIDARAAQLRLDLEEIEAFADQVPRLSMRSRLQSLDAGLTGFGGPVTSQTTASMAGAEPPTRLYVSASENGTVRSMLGSEGYVREGFRSDNWLPDSSTGIGLDELEVRAGEIYPIAFNSSQTTSRGIEIVDTGIYRIDIGYEQGEIVAYLDGGTESVFYEIQRRPLQQIQPGPAVVARDNGTRLSVNQTFEGGPLRVAVTNNQTGSPVSADVVVEDARLTTGPDGVAWTLMPPQTIRVTAVTERGNVTLSVSPVQNSSANSTTTSSMAAGGLRTTTDVDDALPPRTGR